MFEATNLTFLATALLALPSPLTCIFGVLLPFGYSGFQETVNIPNVVWAAVELKSEHFQGFVKIPESVLTLVNQGGAQGWSRLIGLWVGSSCHSSPHCTHVCFAILCSK